MSQAVSGFVEVSLFVVYFSLSFKLGCVKSILDSRGVFLANSLHKKSQSGAFSTDTITVCLIRSLGCADNFIRQCMIGSIYAYKVD